MKAIILAAGNGLRLKGTTGGSPKCLLDVGGITLIARQIRALRLVGISDIVVVVGYGAGMVRATCGPALSYVTNDRFETTNSLFSLWLAREHLSKGFIVLNADVLFDTRILATLLASRHENALLFEPVTKQPSELGEEEMKVRITGGRVVEISKLIDPSIADGENVGIAKFGPSGAKLIIRHMARILSRGDYHAWVPQAFQAFAEGQSLFAISTAGYPWIEIDFPEDYHKARLEILPRIESSAYTTGSKSRVRSNIQ